MHPDCNPVHAGKSALHVAAAHGAAECAAALLRGGADAAAAAAGGLQPLHLAAASDHLAVVDTLLAGGAPCDAMGGAELAPLHLAAGSGALRALSRLLQAGHPQLQSHALAAATLCPQSLQPHVSRLQPCVSRRVRSSSAPQALRGVPRSTWRVITAAQRPCSCCSARAPTRALPTRTARPLSIGRARCRSTPEVPYRLGNATAHHPGLVGRSPPRLLAALRTQDKQRSRSGPNGRLRCGRAARPKSSILQLSYPTPGAALRRRRRRRRRRATRRARRSDGAHARGQHTAPPRVRGGRGRVCGGAAYRGGRGGRSQRRRRNAPARGGGCRQRGMPRVAPRRGCAARAATPCIRAATPCTALRLQPPCPCPCIRPASSCAQTAAPRVP